MSHPEPASMESMDNMRSQNDGNWHKFFDDYIDREWYMGNSHMEGILSAVQTVKHRWHQLSPRLKCHLGVLQGASSTDPPPVLDPEGLVELEGQLKEILDLLGRQHLYLELLAEYMRTAMWSVPQHLKWGLENSKRRAAANAERIKEMEGKTLETAIVVNDADVVSGRWKGKKKAQASSSKAAGTKASGSKRKKRTTMPAAAVYPVWTGQPAVVYW